MRSIPERVGGKDAERDAASPGARGETLRVTVPVVEGHHIVAWEY